MDQQEPTKKLADTQENVKVENVHQDISAEQASTTTVPPPNVVRRFVLIKVPRKKRVTIVTGTPSTAFFQGVNTNTSHIDIPYQLPSTSFDWPPLGKKKIVMVKKKQEHMYHTVELSYYDMHDEKFVCTLCNKKFIHRQSIEEHILSHDKMDNFTCVECSQVFYSSPRQMLEKKIMMMNVSQNRHRHHGHLLSQLNSRERRRLVQVFVCEICRKKFSCKTWLKIHKKVSMVCRMTVLKRFYSIAWVQIRRSM
ncbi:gastrula zinc finger protein XlCGF52.1-like [Daktulosphaira vitifoliae]|uniref:gastrula zinc finger protein XlCGF52.1-like n=1 Tax=Daktulosphaira vitifoliae TaxID=58002 RepID=UPI0021AA87A3|nr:gastrula zinc finger protein XlCGF52.1-like [Daktulosphaira vitifoliae]